MVLALAIVLCTAIVLTILISSARIAESGISLSATRLAVNILRFSEPDGTDVDLAWSLGETWCV